MKKHSINFAIISLFLLAAGAYIYSTAAGTGFPHKKHLDNKVNCVDCHVNIEKSTTTDGGIDIPSKKFCFEGCHEKKEPYSNIQFKYQQSYKFNHKLHVKGQSLDCKECHAAISADEGNAVKLLTSDKLPKMDYCFGCHDNSTATKYCMLCHVNKTKPDDHDADWVKNKHKLKANANMKDCLSCHKTKNYCLDCHKGVAKLKKPMSIHEPNYETTHKYDSRLSMNNCKSCHAENFCKDCHNAKGLNSSKVVNRLIHPIGWTTVGSSNFHGKKGKIRLTSCTSCHTRNDCAFCHLYRR